MPEPSPSSLTFFPAFCWTASPTFNVWAKVSAADVHSLTRRPGNEGQRIYFYQNHPIRFVRLVGLVVSFDEAASTTMLHGDGKLSRTVNTPWIFALDDGSGAVIDVVCWQGGGGDEGDNSSNNPGRQRLATRPGERITLDPSELGGQQGQGQGQGQRQRRSRLGRSVSGVDVDLAGVALGRVVKVKGWVDEYRGRRQILLERVSLLHGADEEARAWLELARFQLDVLAKPWLLSGHQVDRLRRRDEKRQARRRGEARSKDREKAREDGKGQDALDKDSARVPRVRILKKHKTTVS